VVVPFLLFHAYEGWMGVRYRVASRRIEGRIARAIEKRCDEPPFQVISAALGRAEELEKSLASWPGIDHSLDVIEAEQRLGEISRRLQSANDLSALPMGLLAKNEALQTDLNLQHAEERLRTMITDLEGSPLVAAYRRRLERLGTDRRIWYTPATLEQQLAALKQHYEEQPRVAAIRQKITGIEADLETLRAAEAQKAAELNRRREPIYWAPGRSTRSLLQDAWEEWLAAQALFDYEYARLMRYLDCPGYLRWLEALRLQFGHDRLVSAATAAPLWSPQPARRIAYAAAILVATVALGLAILNQ
jgi:hypothetical protein